MFPPTCHVHMREKCSSRSTSRRVIVCWITLHRPHAMFLIQTKSFIVLWESKKSSLITSSAVCSLAVVHLVRPQIICAVIRSFSLQYSLYIESPDKKDETNTPMLPYYTYFLVLVKLWGHYTDSYSSYNLGLWNLSMNRLHLILAPEQTPMCCIPPFFKIPQTCTLVHPHKSYMYWVNITPSMCAGRLRILETSTQRWQKIMSGVWAESGYYRQTCTNILVFKCIQRFTVIAHHTVKRVWLKQATVCTEIKHEFITARYLLSLCDSNM